MAVEEGVRLKLPDELTIALEVVEQPVVLLTVTVYVPAARPLMVAAVPLLLHAYVNGPVPALTATVAVPVLPEQPVLVAEAERVIPCPRTIEPVAEHPPVVLTVTV